MEVGRELDDGRGGVDAATEAAAVWRAVRGAPEIEVARTPDGSTPLVARIDGRNAIVQVPARFGALRGALAVTVVSSDARSGKILDADILVSRDLPGAAAADHEGAAASRGEADRPIGRAPRDLVRLLAHEMGHVLGLADEPDAPDALMFPVVGTTKASTPMLSDDDARGLASLYASDDSDESRADANGGGCAVGALPRGPLGGIGLSALLLFLARRRQRALVGLGAVGLVALCRVTGAEAMETPPAALATGIVRSVDVECDNGVFVTASLVELEDGTSVSARSWGGRVGDVMQVVGHEPAPSRGDRVQVDLRNSSAGVVAAASSRRAWFD